MTDEIEYEFDEETINMLLQAQQAMDIFRRAIPIMEKLNKAELDLLDRLMPYKGVLADTSSKELKKE